MKHKKSFRSLMTLAVCLFICTINNNLSAQVSCSYAFLNNKNCTVWVTFEYIDNSCQSMCSGPQTVACPPGTPFLTPTGCSCTGAQEIVFNITSVGPNCAFASAYVSVYGGCSGTYATSDSGTITCAGGTSHNCNFSSYSLVASAAGATLSD